MSEFSSNLGRRHVVFSTKILAHRELVSYGVRMSRVPRFLSTAAFLVLATLAAPPSAAARPKADVEWTRVDALPTAKDGARLAKNLHQLLKEASRKADFGKSGKVLLRARIAEYVVEQKGDVLRIRCTVIGRLENGPSAKSRIAFGGDPKDPKALEKQVLTMVAHGVTSRLAALAKARASEKKAASADPKREHSPTVEN
jgi:hypothetical protein